MPIKPQHVRIHNEVEKLLKSNGIDKRNFYTDLVAFNKDRSKCVVILDNGRSPKQFLIAGLKTHNGLKWEPMRLDHLQNNYDAMDAIEKASEFLESS